MVLFDAYTEDLKYFSSNAVGEVISLGEPDFSFKPLCSCWFISWWYASLLICGTRNDSSWRAGSAIVEEVRKQFKEKPGIMTGEDKPDYSSAVDLLTKSAIKEMIVPSLLPLLSPMILFYTVNFIATKNYSFSALEQCF